MLQRRKFLGLLAGIAGSILALIRALRPSPWWKRPTRVERTRPIGAQTASIENQSGIKITTIRRWKFRNFGGVSNDLGKAIRHVVET
jgi:hypothetical protein